MSLTICPINHRLDKQKGAVLIVSLVILLVMTLIGVASMGTSMMQERMASNAQSANSSFQAAESGVASLIATVDGGAVDELDAAMDFTNIARPRVVVNIQSADLNVGYQLTHLGVAPGTGSIGSSFVDSDEAPPQVYNVTANGVLQASGAQSVLRRGIIYPTLVDADPEEADEDDPEE